MTLKIITHPAPAGSPDGAQTLTIANDADIAALAAAQAFDGVQRIDLHFPKFTDGRAYSQALLLRRRYGFAGDIRATGEVLIDQLVQMERSGFSSAVLAPGVDPAAAERQFTRFASFYQGDALQPQPHFARGSGEGSAAGNGVDESGAPGQASPLPNWSASAHARAIDLYAQPSPTFDAKLDEAAATLRQAAATGAVVQANSLGAEDMALTHLINQLGLSIGIFVLDTGALHPETLALLAQLQAQQATHPNAPLTVYQPQPQAVARFIEREGADAMYRSLDLRKACCAIRKLEPLARALAGKQGWITGLRREQSDARTDTPLIDRSEFESKRLIKFNPLADWTWGDVWHYIATRGALYNPLHDHFYPSIGCAPCTRAITLGEDFRAGRWWWENEAAKECGLHVRPHSDGALAPSGPSLGGRLAREVSAQAHVAAGDVKDATASDRSQNENTKECGLHVKSQTAPQPTGGNT